MDFASRIANVHLDEEFGPLEELLTSSKVGYLNFLRVLKLCWELVDQKSEEKIPKNLKRIVTMNWGSSSVSNIALLHLAFLEKI